MKTKLVIILTVVCVLCACERPAPFAARAILASNGTPSDVQAKHDQASEGDTITLPAGTFSWTSGVTITKGVTIQGLTTTNTASGTPNDQTAVDKTILVDNIPRQSDGPPYFKCTTTTGQSLRITGITFTSNGGLPDANWGGVMKLSGDSANVRIDHCHFSRSHGAYGIFIYGAIFGVIDHNVANNYDHDYGFAQVMMSNYGGLSNGDGAFIEGAGYGGPKFLFFEDNWLWNDSQLSGGGNGSIDCARGGKYVIRYNRMRNVVNLCHGTEGERQRGGRAMEDYNNERTFTVDNELDGIRSGSMIAHDNTFIGVQPNGFALATFRTMVNQNAIWGGADGGNPWDVNVTEADGTYVEGHAPYLFESGTATSGSQNTITDTSKNWAPNQWNGYEVRRASDQKMARITGNTNNTLNVLFYSDPGGLTWAAGNQYQVRKVLVVLDSPCRGKGDQITGSTPINSVKGSPYQLHQQLEPCYSWNNVHPADGKHINFRFSVATPPGLLVLGRDYFQDTPMPGYTPYAYPHPLVSNMPAPSPSPTAPVVSPVPVPTVGPTVTATAAATATATPAWTTTATPTATATPRPTPTTTPTATSAPTATAQPTATATAATTPAPSPTVAQPTPAAPITLWGTGAKDKGELITYLNWSGTSALFCDIYRNGKLVASVQNDGEYTDVTGAHGHATFTYKVCDSTALNCSNETQVNF